MIAACGTREAVFPPYIDLTFAFEVYFEGLGVYHLPSNIDVGLKIHPSYWRLWWTLGAIWGKETPHGVMTMTVKYKVIFFFY